MKTQIIDSTVASMFMDALQKEMLASHTYRHFATKMQMMGYFGTQSFFLGESDDELTHFQKLVDFLNDVGYEAEMPTIPAITTQIDSLMTSLTSAFEMENELLNFYVEIFKMNDPISQQILLEFIEIQRKAVGEYGDLIARLEIIKDDPCGFIIFDQEMKK
jgi:ferritin